MGISFDITDYIGNEVSSTRRDTAEPALPESAKDHLQSLVKLLESDTADLVHNAKPVKDIFDLIKADLPARIREALHPVAHIDYHEPVFIRATERLAAREAQKQLPYQESRCKKNL